MPEIKTSGQYKQNKFFTYRWNESIYHIYPYLSIFTELNNLSNMMHTLYLD